MAGLGISSRLLLLVAVVCFLAIIGEVGARGSRGGSFRGGYRSRYSSYRGYSSYRSGGGGATAGAIVGIIFGVIGGIIALVVLIVLCRIFCSRGSGGSKPGRVISSDNTAMYAASPRPAATVNNGYSASYPYSTATDYKTSYNNDYPAPPSYEHAVNDSKGGSYPGSGGSYPGSDPAPPPVGLSGYSADTNGGLPYSANPTEGAGYSYSSPAPSAPTTDSAGGNSRPIGFEGTPI